jgi:hypothetical protein
MIAPEDNLELSTYEKLVRLTLLAVGGFTLLTLICFLPWRGLIQATQDPGSFGNQPGLTYLIMRLALRAFPIVAGLGLVAGWGLVVLKQMRFAFYVAIAASIGLGLIVASLVLYAVAGGL